jgi:hypothetical protein
MCNPRRIQVHASGELAEAWEQEIRRIAARTDTVVAEARAVEELSVGVAAPTLAELAVVLRGRSGWAEAGGSFRFDLDGGEVWFHPDTAEIELVARISAEVSVCEAAAHSAPLEVQAVVEATGTGVYYDDGWAGITPEDARRAAQEDADRGLERLRRAAHEEARAGAEHEHGERLQAEADARADDALAAVRAERAEELRRSVPDRLIAVGVAGRRAVHEAMADAYRNIVLAYARAHGADGIRCSERDGVVEIEFEMRV